MKRPISFFTLLLAGAGLLSAQTPDGGIIINAAPNSATVPWGASAVFVVSATSPDGRPLDYQWSRNGADIPGAIAAAYATPPTVPADSGTSF